MQFSMYFLNINIGNGKREKKFFLIKKSKLIHVNVWQKTL